VPGISLKSTFPGRHPGICSLRLSSEGAVLLLNTGTPAGPHGGPSIRSLSKPLRNLRKQGVELILCPSDPNRLRWVLYWGWR
jgi:hypothetical protein